MVRAARLFLILVAIAVAGGVPAGMALGSFAAGEAPLTHMAGSSLPEYGTQARSALNADAVQPATVAYTQSDRYAGGGATWVD